MTNVKEIFKVFSGKRFFITGHTGFKGSWLTFLLCELGAEVMGYSLEPVTAPNHFDLLSLRKKIKHVVGDIRDRSALSRAMQDFQPEFVIHLAAQALVRPSYEDPVSTFSTNIMGSIHLLDAVRECKSVRSLVYITSDKCYENVEWIWGYRESDQLGGRDPYSSSKAAAEIVFSSYVKSFFEYRPLLGAASARAGNVIGGGDWAVDRIIPDCIRSIQSEVPIQLRNPRATRPWQHVLEPLAGYLVLAAKLYEHPQQFGGAWNFGPSTHEVKTVKSVAEIIVQHFGYGVINIFEEKTKAQEAMLLQLNCDKAHQLLNWHPRWNADRTLNATAYWYKEVLSGKNPESVTRSQIYEFFPELL